MLRSVLFGLAGVALSGACEKSGPLADLPTSTASTAALPPNLQPPGEAGPPEAPSRAMPPRPVPTTNPTVLVTMPERVQLAAIQYMEAMQAPQPTDAPADPAYAKQIAERLRTVAKTDVVASGRRIDMILERGCDATLPRESVARQTGASLAVLLAHGVLVVRCADRMLQCLQSTRDANDVLCTHK